MANKIGNGAATNCAVRSEQSTGVAQAPSVSQYFSFHFCQISTVYCVKLTYRLIKFQNILFSSEMFYLDNFSV